MSERIRTVIVDDEALARARLIRLLERERDVEVVAECKDGPEAVSAVRSHLPDLLFLDVQMPAMDGFQVLSALGPDAAPALVFVTAFDRFAVRAFDACAVDYLLKPFDGARLGRAVARARQELADRRLRPLGPRLEALLDAVQPAAPAPARARLAVPDGERIRLLDIDEIDYLEAEGNYVEVFTGGRSHLVRETLSAMEARLDPRKFVRIHRSRIVRVDRIRELEPLAHGEYRLTLRSGAQVTSARSYRAALRAALKLDAADPG